MGDPRGPSHPHIMSDLSSRKAPVLHGDTKHLGLYHQLECLHRFQGMNYRFAKISTGKVIENAYQD